MCIDCRDGVLSGQDEAGLYCATCHRREKGVEEFARVLEIDPSEARTVYELIGQHQSQVFALQQIENKLSLFALRFNSQEQLDKLVYLQNHFIAELGRAWMERIRVLRGEPDGYMRYLQEELEKQELRNRNAQLEAALRKVVERMDVTQSANLQLQSMLTELIQNNKIAETP